MLNGTGQTGVIRAIHSEGLTAEQVRRQATVEVEGIENYVAPVDLIRLGLH